MSSDADWKGFTTKGNLAQELVCDYLINKQGFRFLAGDRNGVTKNIEYIEEVFNCNYVPIVQKKHGPRLSFYRDGNYTAPYIMPDELLCMERDNSHVWFEIKNRRMDNLKEYFWKLKQYEQVSVYCDCDVYLTCVVWNKTGYDIWAKEIKSFMLNRYDKNKSEVSFDLSTFVKLNNTPIHPKN